MRIYIDESGSFIPDAASTRVCCEAALAVPECFAQELLDRFVELRRTWTSEPELKGSALSDERTAAALKLLSPWAKWSTNIISVIPTFIGEGVR